MAARQNASERRNRNPPHQGCGAPDGRRDCNRQHRERAHPIAKPETLDRRIFRGEADQHTGRQCQHRNCKPSRRFARAIERFCPTGKARHKEDRGREFHAGHRLHQPMGMIGHRPSPGELGHAVIGVEQAPVPAHGAFKLAFPRLVERLDDVHVEAIALGEGDDVMQHARLLDR